MGTQVLLLYLLKTMHFLSPTPVFPFFLPLEQRFYFYNRNVHLQWLLCSSRGRHLNSERTEAVEPDRISRDGVSKKKIGKF